MTQIEIKTDPKDWHALRISHRDLEENLVPIRMNYEYYRADVVIDGQLVKSVGVRKKGPWGSTARPSLKIKLDEYYYFYRDAASGKFSFTPWGADLGFFSLRLAAVSRLPWVRVVSSAAGSGNFQRFESATGPRCGACCKWLGTRRN